MNTLQVVQAYLAARRSVGIGLVRAGRYLRQFAKETGNIPLSKVSRRAVDRYLRGRDATIGTWRTKRSTLAGLYRYAIPRGFAAASPLPEEPPRLAPPQTPYVYSTEEIQHLLDATTVLESHNAPLQAWTYRTLLTVLYSSGLRVGEAIALRICDVDLNQRLISVRQTKFFKSRLVSIGPRLCRRMARYLDRRRLLNLPEGEQSAFLCTRTGHGLVYQEVCKKFQHVRSAAGIRTPHGERRPPRIHDLRHTAAVHRVVTWYRSGKDVQQLLPALATYLGHVSIQSTQRYLHMTPELLEEASRRFARFAAQESPHD
jgi:site-specific recombinase XerD